MWFTWCAPFQVQLFWLPFIFLSPFLPLVHFFWCCGVSVYVCVCVSMLTIWWTIQMFEFQSSANRIHMIFAVLDRNFHWRHLLKFSYARNWFEILVLCSAFEIDSTFTNRFCLCRLFSFALSFFFLRVLQHFNLLKRK